MNDSIIQNILKQAPYFTKQNLGLALGKEGETLNYWIKKLIRERQIVVLKKGLYISSYFREMVSQIPGEQERYWEYLANILCEPSYVSLEYMLAKRSVIPESVFAVTSVTTKSSRRYQGLEMSFQYKSLKQELFFGFEKSVFRGRTVRAARTGKALFDLFYLRPFSSMKQATVYVLDSGRLNWDAVTEDERMVFFEAVERSQSRKMARIAKIIEKNI